MRPEIRSASMFLADLLRLGHTLTDHQVRLFRGTLEDLLRVHYHHHWFPERPCKGSGYRCIRINHRMDPMIAKAAVACGINDSTLLRNVFPNELTMWIDPREVSYRIGENGSICVLYDEVPDQVAIAAAKMATTTSATVRSHVNNQRNVAGNVLSCKDSVRGMDNFIMDRRNLNLDQFAPYVSS